MLLHFLNFWGFFFSQNKIEGSITLEKNKMLFLSIPYDKGWEALDNGKEIELKLINYGLTGMILVKGSHDIVLQYSPPYYVFGKAISLISIIIFI